MIFWN